MGCFRCFKYPNDARESPEKAELRFMMYILSYPLDEFPTEKDWNDLKISQKTNQICSAGLPSKEDDYMPLWYPDKIKAFYRSILYSYRVSQNRL